MSTKCHECKRSVPNGTYLHPLVTSEGIIAPICAVCALEITNKMHGINRLEFNGGEAERLRRETAQHYQDTNQ